MQKVQALIVISPALINFCFPPKSEKLEDLPQTHNVVMSESEGLYNAVMTQLSHKQLSTHSELGIEIN